MHELFANNMTCDRLQNGLYIVGGVNSNNEAYDDVWHYDFGT